MDLDGKVAIVTGASRGLGKAITQAFIRDGARVVMAARTLSQLSTTAAELNSNSIKLVACDIRDEFAVDRLVAETLLWSGKVDILVCNAGIYGPIGPVDKVDWQEWLDTFETNLFGSIACCRAVLPTFRQQLSGKIIVISGGGASSGMPNFSAYAVSKTALVRFVETLAMEVADCHIDVNAVAPGALNTRMLDQVIDAGCDQVGPAFYKRALVQLQNGGDSLERAAQLVSLLASSKTNGISGCLFSAVWDQWQSIPDQRDSLSNTDKYKLRRII